MARKLAEQRGDLFCNKERVEKGCLSKD